MLKQGRRELGEVASDVARCCSYNALVETAMRRIDSWWSILPIY